MGINPIHISKLCRVVREVGRRHGFLGEGQLGEPNGDEVKPRDRHWKGRRQQIRESGLGGASGGGGVVGAEETGLVTGRLFSRRRRSDLAAQGKAKRERALHAVEWPTFFRGGTQP